MEICFFDKRGLFKLTSLGEKLPVYLRSAKHLLKMAMIRSPNWGHASLAAWLRYLNLYHRACR